MSRLPPHIEKDLADHFLGEGDVAEKAQGEAVNPHIVPCVQHRIDDASPMAMRPIKASSSVSLGIE